MFNIGRDLIIIDCETTGITIGTSGIIQLSAYKLNRDLQIDQNYFDVYIKSYVDEWTQESENIHGITREFLDQNGLTLNRAIKSFLNWTDYSGRFYITQWGCGFDAYMLRDAFERDGVKYPFTHRSFDISSIVRFFLAVNGLQGESLKECADYLGIDMIGFMAHNSRWDAYLATVCLKKILENGFVKKNSVIKQT